MGKVLHYWQIIERVDNIDIYEKLNDCIYCPDLIECGYKLIDFAESAMLEKNRGTIVKLFYERIAENAFIDYAFDNMFEAERYFIFSGRKAKSKYLGVFLPKQESPVKSLNAIKVFGNYIIKNFKNPIGPIIEESKINEIMQYLNASFNFSEKVFSDQAAIIALVDYSHVGYNSHCFISVSETRIVQHLFLYHLKSKNEYLATPESVFFHELGHALHARYYRNAQVVPPDILEFLKNLCFANIDTLKPLEQCEVFADILSVGLMLDSPFEKYDPFTMMHKGDKKQFKKIVEKMISEI